MSSPRPVLIVEDDNDLRQTLIEQIKETGSFIPFGAATLTEAKGHLYEPEARFDSIILDVGLPDGDGRDLCRDLRQRGDRMPIIMLTGLSTEADVISCLDAGANDVVHKPFRANELVARLAAQLRVFDGSEHAVFTIGPYTFRPSAKLLVSTDKKHRIRMTAKEVSILKFLYRSGNHPVSRDELLDAVWGYKTGVTTHTLETHIYRLRRKMEPALGDFRLLVTAPGGYRLDAAGAVHGQA